MKNNELCMVRGGTVGEGRQLSMTSFLSYPSLEFSEEIPLVHELARVSCNHQFFVGRNTPRGDW
jgi:hypothetical protein